MCAPHITKWDLDVSLLTLRWFLSLTVKKKPGLFSASSISSHARSIINGFTFMSRYYEDKCRIARWRGMCSGMEGQLVKLFLGTDRTLENCQNSFTNRLSSDFCTVYLRRVEFAVRI